jgi:hypothetical protein
MAVIVWFSTGEWSAEHTGGILIPLLRRLAPSATTSQLIAAHFLVRKLGHFTVYSILAGLWFRAFASGGSWSPRGGFWLALTITVAWAILDETHQAWVPTRTASVGDVLIDTSGGLVTLGVARLGWRQSLERATTALLWAAAAGGVAALIVNAVVGVGSGLLWLTAPAAAVLLATRRLFRGRA